MLLPQLALRDSHETGKASFGSQQIVEAGVTPVFGYVETNRQQLSRLVEQEVKLSIAEFEARPGQLFVRFHSRSGMIANLTDPLL